MIAHYLINPDMRHNMDVLSETYLKYAPKSIETLIGKKGKNQLSMRDVPLEDIKEYATEDADITFQLKENFQPILEKVGTKKLFDEIEIPLVPVLADMEKEGDSNLDVEFLAKSMSVDMQKEIDAFEQQIYETAGEKFNLASPKQLGDILFDKKNWWCKTKENQNRSICHWRRSFELFGKRTSNCARYFRMASNGEIAKYLY